MFKRSIVVACLAVGGVASSGCALPGAKSQCGFTFCIHKPPVMSVETPVLINQNMGDSSVHPMGTLAGPISQGSATHAPIAPTHATPQTPILPLIERLIERLGQRRAAPGDGALGVAECGDPCPRLTADEWRAVQRACAAHPGAEHRRLPVGPVSPPATSVVNVPATPATPSSNQ